jgi:uncharacterized protein YdeI (YjbR/CyaY-like superfamily)
MPGRAEYFKSPAEFRAWLEKNHAKVTELWIGFYNARSKHRGITYQEALDEALCYGWIDGVRKSVDTGRYVQRWTPRRAASKWSAVNVRHVARLTREGRMRPPGVAAFARRTAGKGRYSYEERPGRLSPALEQRFRTSSPRGWKWFKSQAPYYQRLMTFYVMSARRDDTRTRRLERLIDHSDREERIPLSGPAKTRS